MKRIIILSALFLVFHSTSFAQKTDNSISMKSGFFGWQFYQNGQKLKVPEVAKMMESNPQAYTYIQSARTNNTWASIIGTIGGFMVGYPLGQAAGGGNANWTVAGIGGGLIIAAIPISIKANKQAKNAIAAYNEGLRSTSFRKAEFDFGFTGNGIGLTVHF
ncbi:MAG: hypothetical protein JWR72_2447 [Flavisolibacter sp.]|nr:hypothetical protein [Flavisolibacter sp.]